MILCGDVNINTSSENTKTVTKDYKNLLMSFGCINLINKYTRIATDINGETTKTVIDHIITNISTNQTKSGVLYYHISDHLPIFSVFKLKMERQRLQPREKRVYNNVGKLKFIRSLQTYVETLRETSNNDFDDPERILNDLIAVIKHAEDKAFPLRKMSRKNPGNFESPG